MTSFDVDISDGILGRYWPHVGCVDCVVKFNTADLALGRFWAPDCRCRVAFASVSIYRATFYGSWRFCYLLIVGYSRVMVDPRVL